MDRTRDILDYAFILKYFKREWGRKYVDLTDHAAQPICRADLQPPNPLPM